MTDTHERITAARPLFADDDIDRITNGIAQVLRSGRLILGPVAKELERSFAQRVGTRHAVSLSSCTAALETVYRFLKVEGRQVVVPTNTFVATANAIRFAGGTPVFADMSDAGDFGIDVDDALSKIGPETAAVVIVHISGLVGPAVSRLLDECCIRGIPVIEDCAHAQGARLGDREVGGLGRAGCFSFYPTKILTSGTGGMLTTDDDDLAAFARSLRHHGQGESLETIVNAGNDWVLDEIRCVVAHAQLAKLDHFIARRRALAARYEELLGRDRRFVLPNTSEQSFAVWYKYPILLPPGVSPKAVRDGMSEMGIEVGALYSPPVHLMPVFREAMGTGPGLCPTAEALLARQITLPMHAALELTDVDRSLDALNTILAQLQSAE